MCDHSKTPILFLHHYVGSIATWERVLTRFEADDTCVYAVDQRGHGLSSIPDSSDAARFAFERFAEDAIAFLDAMEIEAAVFAGNSMSGLISQIAALTYPERVSGLVLIGTGKNGAFTNLLGFNDLIQAQEPIDHTFAALLLPTSSSPDADVPQEFIEENIDRAAAVPADIWKEVFQEIINVGDLEPQLPNITVPTVIVWGQDDGVWDVQEQLAMNTHIAGSTLLIRDRVGHFVQWDDPAFLTRVVQELVADIDAARAPGCEFTYLAADQVGQQRASVTVTGFTASQTSESRPGQGQRISIFNSNNQLLARTNGAGDNGTLYGLAVVDGVPYAIGTRFRTGAVTLFTPDDRPGGIKDMGLRQYQEICGEPVPDLHAAVGVDGIITQMDLHQRSHACFLPTVVR
ncbi:MAG: alpha/beta hydrolase [Chloroflexaceae bacterium]|nr:alpha/beta hydrolase [Chloroflexaceae bacterium]